MKRVFLLLLACCLLTAPAAAAGGSGTAADPYIIQTAAELQSIQNNLAAYYKLANDINLQAVSFTPIGSTSSPFIGSFDGAGYTISNLVISSSTQSTGFFSCLGSGATIKDVTFTDCTVTSTSSQTGTVFGSIIMSATIHDVATFDNVDCVRCTVTGSYDVGAIGGCILSVADIDMRSCDVNFANVECTSGTDAGVIGIMDYTGDLNMIGGSVKNSCFETSGGNVGAIMGRMARVTSASINDVDIEFCIIKTSGGNTGGAIGCINNAASVSMNGVVVKNCIIKGSGYYTGGLIGIVERDYNDNSYITGSNSAAINCIVSDSTIVAITGYAGGICGRIVSQSTGVFDNCAVSGCTIQVNTYVAGVCPAYN